MHRGMKTGIPERSVAHFNEQETTSHLQLALILRHETMDDGSGLCVTDQ